MKITCSVPGRTAKVVLAASAFLVGAVAHAAPTISIVSPGLGVTVRNDPKPTVAVTYSSDDPSAPLDLASLVVTVNGVDVTSKFTASASSATWTLGPDDQLVAGTVTIYGSIRDAGGHLASTSGSYEVLPSFQAIAPAAVHQGDAVTLSAWGLDPTAGANMAVFPDPFTAGGVQATFEGVDVASRTGSVRVPETAITGNLQLVVNGKAAPETLPLAIYGPIPDCGDIQEVHFTSDGGAVVHFFRRSRPMEPACPDVPGTAVSFVARLNPDRTISLLAQGDLSGWPDDFVLLDGFVLDKGLMDPAIFSQRMTNGSASNQVQYKNRYLVGIPRVGSGDTANLAADFDREGNLYLLYYDDADLPRIGRLHLDTGTVTPVGVGLPSSPYSWNSVFVIGCDGFAYVGVNEGDPNPEYYLLFKVDLATGSVVSQMTVGGRYLADLTVSCQTNELLASQEVTGPEWHVEAVRFSDMVGPQLLGALLPPSWDSPVTVGPNGVVYLYSWSGSQRLMVPVPGGPQVAICEGTALPHCPCPPGLRRGPNQTCEQPPLAILPSTTRWKPQRSDGPMVVEFSGPDDLDLTTPGTLEIQPPAPAPPVTVTGAIALVTTGCGAGTGQQCYRLTWPGPWTYTDDGEVKRLPAGNYTVVVKAVAGDSSPPRQVVSAPYDKVSLVEVKRVELVECGSIQGVTCQDGGAALDNNTAPGGGKAAFPDAAQQGSDYRRTVLVKAELEPNLGPDTGQVTVHFRSIDVDDPSAGRDTNGTPIDDPVDNDLVATPDNRNENGQLVLTTTGDPNLGGAAVSHFQVSTQQGNNYRLAATTYEPWLADLCGVVSSTSGELVHGPCTTSSNGTPLSTDPANNEAAQVSDMLTVWRTLHVELDRIDPATAGVTQQTLDQHRDWTDLKRSRLINRATGVFDADHDARDDWLGAQVSLDFHPQDSYPVTRNRSDRADVDIPSGSPNLLNGQRPRDIAVRGYTLRDDELQRFLTVGHDLDMLAGLLQQVYVRLERHAGDAINPNTALPWTRVMTSGPALGLPRDTVSSKPFWAVPLVLALDGMTRRDDPSIDDRENERRDTADPSNYSAFIDGRRQYFGGLLGVTYPGPGGGVTQPRSLSFVETIRDLKETNTTPAQPTVSLQEVNASNAAHEVLHSLTLAHRGGIMCARRKNDASDPMRFSLTRTQLSELRDVEQPEFPRKGEAICSPTVRPPDCCPKP